MISLRAVTGTAAASMAIAAATVIAQRNTAAPVTPAIPADVTVRIVAAAQAVVNTLDAAGRAKVQYRFDSPQKTRWSNLPSPLFQREGLRLADLTSPQRAAVMTLLQTALSKEGYQKVTDIMLGDEILKTTNGGRG